MDESEAESKIELVRARAVVAGPGGDVDDVRLSDENTGGFERVGEPAPGAQDLVRLGAVHRIDAADAERARMRVVVLGRRHVVSQLWVLDQCVRDIDSKSGHATVEPE